MSEFTIKHAVREQVPLLVGLAGPSGSGKSYSALRLASGIQSVTGGKVVGIDTESRRLLHYADTFPFEHVEFASPFGAARYLDAIRFAHAQGASVIIVDSMTHEHDGEGGLLESHEAEWGRLGHNESTKFLAWVKPKQARRRLISSILQIPCHFIFCFRAKEGVKPVKRDGKTQFEQQGFTPISGSEFLYECTVCCVLPPNSGGVPLWQSEYTGERSYMKLPVQFKELFAQPRPLDEDIGKALAEWAHGGEKPAAAPDAVDTAGALQRIKEVFIVNGVSGQSKGEKAERQACFRDFFGCERWADVEKLNCEALLTGLEQLRNHFESTDERDAIR